MTPRARISKPVAAMLAASALFMAALLPSAPALAQALAILQASAYEDIPATFPIRVRPMANTAIDRDLVGVFETALDEAGYDLSAPGAYVFSFRVSGAVSAEQPRSNLQLQGRGGSRDGEDVSLALRFSTGPEERRKPGRDQILLAQLRDPSGHVVWDARLSVLKDREPMFETISALAPSLIGELGREALGRQLP